MQKIDPIFTEVVKGAFAWTCEEMGIILRNTAFSPNIKERMDHSCAFFLPDGKLISQAEHIPVHLGSMVWCMKKFLENVKDDFEEGDIWMFNDPYISGTHLNDVTVVSPFFFKGKLEGFLCVKAHIVDVGGKVPGSISSDATEIWQEGIVLPPVKIFERGRLRRDILEIFLANVRTPDIAKGDINAIFSAVWRGKERAEEIFSSYGVERVRGACKAVIRKTAQKIKRRIRKLPDDELEVQDVVEVSSHVLESSSYKDLIIRLNLKKRGEKIIFDFSKSSPQADLPFNAVEGVVWSAVMYGIKCIFEPEGVPNSGLLEPIEIRVREGTFLNPKKPAPVSGGNLETSQRLADVVLIALSHFFPKDVPACGQGTMNNVMVGGIREDGSIWTFYETVGGGAGACFGKDGESGVHVNMTNTMNTPIEVMELEYPLIFLTYRLRKGSGGRGRWKGGEGIVRAWKLSEGKATLTFVGSRRKTRPKGLAGGEAGKPGGQYVVKGGKKRKIPFMTTLTLEKGDEFWLLTPGGGGWGKKEDQGLERKTENKK